MTNKRLFNKVERPLAFSAKTMDEIDKAYKRYKKGKIKKMRSILLKLRLSDIVDPFIYGTDTIDKSLFRLELNYVYKIIVMLKANYENAGPQYLVDEKYDAMLDRFKLFRDEPISGELIVGDSDRAEAKTKHEYPELKGTLDKAKFIISEVGDSSTYHSSVEKFIDRCLEACYELGRTEITINVSYKYDGTSLVLSFNKLGELKSAITRGKDGKGVEVSHLFETTTPIVPGDESIIAVQCEVMMSDDNIARYSSHANYEFKNSRGSVTSILTALDGGKYSKYLDLVPLKALYYDNKNRLKTYPNVGEISMKDHARIAYNGKRMTFGISKNVDETCALILAKVASYSVDILKIREQLGYQIDGLVVECMDADVIEYLGRKGEINQYQIAYKFKSSEKETTLRDVTYSVGRTGLVIPKAIYDQVEFNGTRQTKATLGSRLNMSGFNMRIGDTVVIEYANDVIPYFKGVTRSNGGEVVKFPTVCPVCHHLLVEIGAHSYCIYDECPAKVTLGYTKFMKALDYRDFSEKFIDKLYDSNMIKSYADLLKLGEKVNYIVNNIDGIGYKKMDAYIEHTNNIIGKITEDKIINAFGITGTRISARIANAIPLKELLEDPDKLHLVAVEGLASKKNEIVDKIYEKRDEMIKVCEILKPIRIPDETKEYLYKVCLTGFRDKELIEKLKEKKVEVVSGFKNIDYLVVPNITYKNAKTAKAENMGIAVIDASELRDVYGIEE